MSSQKILVTDDDPEELFATTRILKKSGYIVEEASSGEEAIETARQFVPDLILLDVVMPGIDGFETCRQIKSDRQLRESFVVLLSSIKKTPDYKAEGLNAGADGFIGRPFHINEFVSRINSIMRIKAVEKELRLQRQWLRITLSSIGEGLIATDDDGRIMFMNPVAEKITGWSAEEASGRNADEIFNIIDSVTKQPLKGPIGKVLNKGKIIQLDDNVLLITKNQNRIPVADSASPIRDEKNGIVGSVLVFRDITEQIKLEERVQQSQKMESIGSLAGGIAHDFNNLLFPIMGMAELLMEDLSPGSLEYENANEILKAGRRGSDLVKQILAFSRQAEHKMIPTRAQSILREVLKLIRSTIPSYIDIHQDIQSDCGLIMADPTQIHQVAMNIITNAYHAVEAGGGDISVCLKERELEASDLPDPHLEAGKHVILSISDTGCGIPPAHIGKIFDPYFTTKEQGKGTGLGLAAVHGIVREHGGAIKVYSETGKGSTFIIYLPLMDRADASEALDMSNVHPVGNERILLVDDEDSVARLEKQVLERLGYKVTARNSSPDALKAFKSNPNAFDLVMTDMTMPDITGDELARELRSIRPDMPVIICTGFSDRMNQEKAELSGIKGFLMKPVVRSEMAQMVRKVLDEPKGDHRF